MEYIPYEPDGALEMLIGSRCPRGTGFQPVIEYENDFELIVRKSIAIVELIGNTRSGMSLRPIFGGSSSLWSLNFRNVANTVRKLAVLSKTGLTRWSGEKHESDAFSPLSWSDPESLMR